MNQEIELGQCQSKTTPELQIGLSEGKAEYTNGAAIYVPQVLQRRVHCCGRQVKNRSQNRNQIGKRQVEGCYEPRMLTPHESSQVSSKHGCGENPRRQNQFVKRSLPQQHSLNPTGTFPELGAKSGQQVVIEVH